MKNETMKDLVKSLPALTPFRSHDVVEVEVLNKTKNAISASVFGITYGIIPYSEWGEEGDNLKAGDKTLAYVMSMEDEDGQALLSLRRADQQRLNLTLSKKYKDKEAITVKGVEANKGGLLCEIGPVRGFLPVSQLSSAHYPRVAGDKNKILEKLRELINQDLRVKIIGFDKKTNHPIFSEKATQGEMVSKIKTGDILEGKVSGIVDFGIFVNLGSFDGLVHISEASWSRVLDLSKLVKLGDRVKVKVIGVENGRVFLSLKRLLPDPFLKAIEKYKEGEVVEGVVTKNTPFGIFVRLDGVDGLVKLSELSEKKIAEGKKYKFKIVKIEKTARKISLSLKQTEKKVKKKKSKEG